MSLRECITQSHHMHMTENENIPTGYFALITWPLKVLGLGAFRPPKDGRVRSNFPLVYVLAVTIPMSVVLVVGLPLMEIGGCLEVSDYADVINSLSFTIVHVFSLLKIVLYVYKNKELQQIAHTLEVGMRKHYQNSAILANTKRLSSSVLLGFSVVVNMTVICACVVASRQDEKPDSLVLHRKVNDSNFLIMSRFPFHVRVPFEARRSWPAFTLAYVYITIAMLVWGYIITFFDTLIASFMLHIRCQLLTLQESLEKITSVAYKRLAKQLPTELNVTDVLRSTVNFDAEDLMEAEIMKYFNSEQINFQLKVCLGECIIHHQHIIRCVEDLESIYTMGYLMQFLSSLGALCLNLCAMSVVELGVSFMIAAGFFSGMLLQLFAQCWAGNEVTVHSLGVAQSAYNCRWYRADERFRKDLLILMVRAQRPLALTAGKFTALSLEAFVSITRGAYSYFAVINSTNN